MSIVLKSLLTLILVVVLSAGIAPPLVIAQPVPAEPRVDVAALLRDLPDGSRWLQHLNQDLLPFWTMPQALGDPIGNFPTYRCNDGSLYDKSRPCPELENPDPSVANIIKLDRDYIRMKSRQTYAYGVAYHMTGNSSYLIAAKSGVDYLRAHALQRRNGKFVGFYSYFTGASSTPGPDILQRTSQDLAYAASGLGFYYYLTRDPAVLQDLLDLKKYIFDTYYDAQKDIITWVKEESPDGDKPNQIELVAQLDQIYGYMIWLAPALPEPYRSEWKKDLQHLAHIMMEQFFTPRESTFWGAITDTTTRQLGTPHTDFGHTVKALWLIYEIGKLTGNIHFIDFGRVHAARILERAYIERTGSWGRQIDSKGNLDEDKEWWILCELDQVSGTLGLLDPGYARYLPQTWEYYFTYMVDHQNHEVWHWVNARDNKPNTLIPKQHSWKNAFHSFEHALVGYIVAEQLHSKPVTLYYKFISPPPVEEITPYLYQGTVDSTQSVAGGFRVSFSSVR